MRFLPSNVLFFNKTHVSYLTTVQHKLQAYTSLINNLQQLKEGNSEHVVRRSNSVNACVTGQ